MDGCSDFALRCLLMQEAALHCVQAISRMRFNCTLSDALLASCRNDGTLRLLA